MTLRDLYTLYRRYVPIASRHPHALGGPSWWPAHEIGHLLTVPPKAIGEPLFGMGEILDDLNDEITRDREHELRCRELAAMSVSSRLLGVCGRDDLAQDEREGTDWETMNWEDGGRVREILRAHGCIKLPKTRDDLETKIRGVVERVR